MSAVESIHARRFRDLIAQRFGLRFEDSKLDLLGSILSEQAAKRTLSPAAYLTEFECTPADGGPQPLITELTVPETYFFRHVEQYRAYADVALPAARNARGANHRMQVLSVGCASGEEPYSLVMWARDHGAWSVDVSAIDLNPAMLTKARRGVYSAWALRETSVEMQQRWFRAVGTGYELDATVRGAVSFQQVNLARPHGEIWLPQRYDVIFCRNVLMYLTTDVAQAAMARMTGALAPHGHLFLGHAETMRGLSAEYDLCHTHGTFYYRPKQPGARHRSASEETLKSMPRPTSASMAEPMPATWPDEIRRSSDRVQALSESFAPPDGNNARAVSDPAPLGAQLQLAMGELKKERFASALALINALPSGAEHDNEVLLLRAALLTHSGQLQDAEKVSAQLLQQDERNAGAHYLLALCRENAGDLRGALDHDEAAISLDADFAMPRLHLGLMARRVGDWVGARSALGEAMPLLKREDAARVLLFGGGFGRDGLIALCSAELQAAGCHA